MDGRTYRVTSVTNGYQLVCSACGPTGNVVEKRNATWVGREEHEDTHLARDYTLVLRALEAEGDWTGSSMIFVRTGLKPQRGTGLLLRMYRRGLIERRSNASMSVSYQHHMGRWAYRKARNDA